MTSKQQLKIKSFVVDTKNYLNGIFPTFDLLNIKFSSSSRLADTFSSWYSFHQENYKDKESKVTHFCNLDSIVFNVSSNPSSVIVILDTNIKNNVTTSIVHVHLYLNSIKKTLH